MGRADARAREDGFRRTTKVTRVVAAGSLALTAVFSWVAARSFAGHTTSTTRTGSSVARRAPRVSDDDGFSTPAQPPSSGGGFNPPAVSGGS